MHRSHICLKSYGKKKLIPRLATMAYPGPKTPLRNLHGVSGGSASFRFLEGVVIIIRHFEISPRALGKICHEVAESS